MTVANIQDFQALDPFFRVIERGLDGLVDGEHFFDLLTEDVVTEFVVTVPGYPRRVEGRDALAELYRDYGDTMRLERTSDLFIHHDREASVVVLEYAVHGQVVRTGPPLHQPFRLGDHRRRPPGDALARLPRLLRGHAGLPGRSPALGLSRTGSVTHPARQEARLRHRTPGRPGGASKHCEAAATAGCEVSGVRQPFGVQQRSVDALAAGPGYLHVPSRV